MLYAVLSDGREMAWKVGQESPIKKYGKEISKNVIEIYANFEELEYIKNSFLNVPIPQNKIIVRWYGDWAKFILNNL